MTPRTARRVRWLLALAIVPLGLVAERVGYPPSASDRASLDLVVGWLLAGYGLVIWARRPDSRTGPILLAAGYVWFLGNFAALPRGPIATLADACAFLFWGFLVHALLTYPTGRVVDRPERVAIPVAYVLSLLPLIWRTDIGPLVLASALALSITIDRTFHRPRDRRRRLPATVAGLTIAVTAGVASVPSLLVPGGGSTDAGVLVTLAVGVGASILAAGMLGWWSRGSDVTDLVVQLGERPGGELANAVADALGDPTLEVGFWSADVGAYLDPGGRMVAPPSVPGRTATWVDRDGEPVALLVHDTAVLADPQLREAIKSATALAAANARLRVEVRAQVAELVASRRRLVDAQDAERRALEERLQGGAAHQLTELAAIVNDVPPAAAGALPGADHRLTQVAQEVRLTHEELDELARGLHPRVLTELGLAGALHDLADRISIPVELSLSGMREPIPEDVAATIWFVCSEALANIAKYAHAMTVTLSIRMGPKTIDISVVDDGCGGADPALGSGLRGLIDRVAAIGGMLAVDSPPGAGTSLAATIPIGRRDIDPA